MSDKRIVQVSKDLFKKFTDIEDHMISFDDLEGQWNATELRGKEMGSAVMVSDEFAAACWIGKNNVSLMISKEEINSIKYLMEYWSFWNIQIIQNQNIKNFWLFG